MATCHTVHSHRRSQDRSEYDRDVFSHASAEINSSGALPFRSVVFLAI